MSDVLAYVEANRERFLEELKEYLRIPSVSTAPEHKGDVEACARWVSEHLKGLGMKRVEVSPTPGYPVVYAEHCEQPGKPTVLLYGHYDVQPPEPLELWKTPPFEPDVREGKIFARGATDDKGQVFAHFKGIEALMARGGELPVNLKVVIEGEEEVGSVNLEAWVREHKERLKCDAVVISDSSMFAPGVPAITYGLRGLMYCEVVVTGPGHDLHSGMYGGAVPNPINVLCGMIGKLHREDGSVAVPGFYDTVVPLTKGEREVLGLLPEDREGFRREVAARGLHGEQGYTIWEQVWARPTLDCNGIWGGYTGEGAKTVIASRATAKMSCRLVPDQDHEEVSRLLEAYLKEVAPESVSVEFKPMHGGNPIVVSRENDTVKAATRALMRAWGKESLFIRSGGSIPVVGTFNEVLGVPSVLVGLGLADDRLHSPNEKFDLENFFKGVETSAYLYEELGKG